MRSGNGGKCLFFRSRNGHTSLHLNHNAGSQRWKDSIDAFWLGVERLTVNISSSVVYGYIQEGCRSATCSERVTRSARKDALYIQINALKLRLGPVAKSATGEQECRG
jgi:hypothetical protein